MKLKVAFNVVLPNIVIVACMISLFIDGWNNPDRAYYMTVSFSLTLFTTITYLGLAIWIAFRLRAYKQTHGVLDTNKEDKP